MCEFLNVHSLNGLWVGNAKDEVVWQVVKVLTMCAERLELFLCGKQHHKEVRPLGEVDIGLLAFMQNVCARFVIVANQRYHIISSACALQQGLVHSLVVGEVVLAVEIANHTQFIGIVAQLERLLLYRISLQPKELKMRQHAAICHSGTRNQQILSGIHLYTIGKSIFPSGFLGELLQREGSVLKA